MAPHLRRRSNRWPGAVRQRYFGLVLVIMLVLATTLGWVLERSKAAVALVLTIGSYLLSQVLVVLTAGFGPWWRQVGSGLRRLIGVEQTTGFNSVAVHVSLTSRLAADATHFGVTYLILGFGAVTGVCQVISAIRHRAEQRGIQQVARAEQLVALSATSAVVYLVYATTLGTLEEQMYYLLLVPGLCTLVIWCHRTGPRLGPHWRKIFAAFIAALLVADGAVWAAVHSTRDDEYRQLLAWTPKHLPDRATIAVTESTAQFLTHGVVIGQWSTVPELVANRGLRAAEHHPGEPGVRQRNASVRALPGLAHQDRLAGDRAVVRRPDSLRRPLHHGCAVMGRKRRSGSSAGAKSVPAVVVGATATVSLVNYAFSLILLWILPARDYAVVASVTALLLVFGTVAGASAPWVLAREVAVSAQDPQRRMRAIAFAGLVALGQALTAALVSSLIVARYADWRTTVTASAAVALIFFSTAAAGYLQGTERFTLLYLLRVSEVVVKVAVGFSLVRAGTGPGCRIRIRVRCPARPGWRGLLHADGPAVRLEGQA